jgi:tRNA pseudouridine38-40 synthase
MAIKNIKITLEYDGSHFHGWQRQKRDRTIQAEIEAALSQIMGGQITVIGSGRTDSGVHALGQVANFRCDTRLEDKGIQHALNSLLPNAIVVLKCQQVDMDFHARYAAKSKTYHYEIYNHPIPKAIGRQYAWHIRRPLDKDGMCAAAEFLIGRHDFSAFEGSGSPRSHSIREIFNAGFSTVANPNHLTFEIEADGFLRFMVRNIVGTLVDLGRGKTDLDAFTSVLRSQDRRQAGATAPPHGLFLVKVSY